MQITDKEALKILKRINDIILWETVDEYPDDERRERTDLEFVADEISWQIYCFNDDSHDWYYELIEAKEKLRETKNGKEIPLDIYTLRPRRGYDEHDIQRAKDIINTYNHMTRALKRLQEKGIYGSWYQV